MTIEPANEREQRIWDHIFAASVVRIRADEKLTRGSADSHESQLSAIWHAQQEADLMLERWREWRSHEAHAQIT